MIESTYIYQRDVQDMLEELPITTQQNRLINLARFIGLSNVGLRIFLYLSYIGELDSETIDLEELLELQKESKTINHYLAEKLEKHDNWDENLINVFYETVETGYDYPNEDFSIIIPDCEDYDDEMIIATFLSMNEELEMFGLAEYVKVSDF